jgi:Tol biopolymer transport system component
MRQVSTSSDVQINPPANVRYLGLTFSPNGDYLYYNAWDKKTPFSLFQMPVLGGASRRLVVDIDSVVTFSPDGKQLAFVRGLPPQNLVSLCVANVDGTAERKLASRKIPSSPSLGEAAWSPDGKVIAWPSGDASGSFMTMVEVSLTDGSEKPISSQRWASIGRLTWLRDGSGLVFTARERLASPSQIWYLSYPGGEVHRITNDLNDYLGVSLTKDSTALVTVETEQVSNIWIAPNDNAHRARQITNTKFDGAEGISWTPDGKIIYASRASGNLDLWIFNANGTGQKQLTADAGNNSRPSVSFDGRYVVFVSDRTGTNHIWRADIDGGNARQLTKSNGESNAQCSPVDPWVVYQPWSDKSGLWKVSIDGDEDVALINKSSAGIAISPDGKWIASAYFEPTTIKTAIYPIEGGEAHKILDIFSFNVRWTPDGRALAYVDQNYPANISSQTVDGRAAKRLTDFTSDRIFRFAWSHDGKQLALARGTLTNDVVLIRNFREPEQAR